MKKFIFLISFISFFNLQAQKISFNLRSGSFNLEINNNFDYSLEDPYRLLIFEDLPNEEQKLQLNNIGIEFLYYLPNNIFAVFLANDISFESLSDYSIISVNKILPEYKIDLKLKQDSWPKWCIKDNLLHVKLMLFNNVDFAEIEDKISVLVESIEEINLDANYITVALYPLNLDLISRLNFISYIEPINPPPTRENMTGRTLHRTNIINVEYSNGNDYNGEGVNIMMHDDGYVEPHIDRKERVDEQFCFNCSSSLNDSHGDHVSGTIMGAGNLDPQARGMADGAFLYVLDYSTNNYYQYVPSLHSNYDVVITSASYGDGCNAGYTSLSSDLDEQIDSYSSLIHVFSAGNSGTSDCGYGAGSGWGNITGGHKQAKNVIAVGNLDYAASLATSSSRGPAEDGRIKPDICAQGTDVYSTYPNYTYNTISGTSMACPGVSGVMAQLYQAYKELNNNANPSSALMKCILLNSADDLGNTGPDFKHGWGVVNASKALNVLKSNNYFNGSISQNLLNTHTINIPSATQQAKIMVYWHDKEGNSSASIALVNNINSQISGPNGNLYLPYVLNTSPNPSSLDQDATYGIDNLNNMEQIVIDNPIPGSYSLQIDGATVPFGPQEYFVCYSFTNDSVKLTYPIGGEGLVPGEYEVIRWDAVDNNLSFSLDYSTNNGVSWNNIANNIASSQRHYVWQIPNIVSDQVKIRVTRGPISNFSATSFTIIDVPSNISVYWPCPDSINISWNTVAGANGYEISMLGEKYMDSVHTTTLSNIWFINPNPNITDCWFSVSAKLNDNKGRRAIAINGQSINSICSGYGCTDATAYNYSSLAIFDDGSCCFVAGCMDISAINYDSTACFDNGTCIAPILGCTNPNSQNYDPNANTTICYGGALDNSFGTGSLFYGDQHLNFDATKACIIKSAMINSESSNSLTFELRNSSGNIIDDTTLSVIMGWQRVYLNFNVPIGNGMQLGVANGNLQNNGLYRNDSGANYPYDIGSAINITSSSATTDPYSYYYFYYDIEVEITCQGGSISSWNCDGLGNCIDPGTGLGQYSSLIQCQSNCVVPSWDCDGLGNCTDPSTGSGQYSSFSQCQNNCVVPSWDCDSLGNCFDPGTGLGQYNYLSECQSICNTLKINEIGLEKFKLYPNPTNNIFNIEFNSKKVQNIDIQIYNILGEIILFENLDKFSGEYFRKFDLLDNSKGVYFIKIKTDNVIINNIIILQ